MLLRLVDLRHEAPLYHAAAGVEIAHATTDPKRLDISAGADYDKANGVNLTKLRRGKKLACFKMRPDMTDDDVTFDYIFDNFVIRGSVNRVVDGILALHEKIGDFGTLLYCGMDWANAALAKKSMELMAEKVMPAVNAAIGQRAAAE